ncbi:S8 family serine peptidase [Aeromicrobium panaciterrae]|uniref:S8 family serine peptidase n=1 Tax=Aeromicrobium panaciterrae TaxID=363861 RepID=UPI0031DDD886
MVTTSVVLGGLSLSASAADHTRGGDVASKPKSFSVSRGLIVKTTTAEPGAAVLKAADAALDADAKVVGSDPISGKVSTIDFSELVTTKEASEAAAEIAKRSDVVWAAPNSLRRAAGNPPINKNDSYYTQQNNLWNRSYTTPVGGYSLKAPYLWRATEGKPSVVVAVLDSGILDEGTAAHPDLMGQTVAGYDMIGEDRNLDETTSFGTFKMAGDNDGRDDDPTDPGDWTSDTVCSPIGWEEGFSPSSWHGTSIAGIIAAKSNNASGIAGIAPKVKIQPVRVLGHCGGWDSDIIAGIEWASGGTVGSIPVNTTPAKIINLSLSGYDDVDYAGTCSMYSEAAGHANGRGSVLIAAAGNDGDFGEFANEVIPASCAGFVSVGASSMRGFGSTYSNYGSSVDLVAPGGDSRKEGTTDVIRSVSNQGTTTATGPTTKAMEGTSMSAAEVSAAAALMASINGDITPAQLENAIVHSVSPFRSYVANYGGLNCVGTDWCGSGILDFGKIQAPISGAKITGEAVAGETLTATPGTWNSNPTFTYTWIRGTTPVGSGTTYVVQEADKGSALTLKVAPANPAFSALDSRVTTDVVPNGPVVTLAPVTGASKFGEVGSTSVTLSNSAAGRVEIRRGTTVLASGDVVADTPLNLLIPGTAWTGGANAIRAAYVGPAGKAFSASQTINIAKVTPSIPWYLPSAVAKGKTTQITVRVKPPASTPVIPDSAATGTIKVYDGSRLILTFPIYGYHNGQRTWGLKFSTRGTHKIKVVYGGNGGLNGVTTAYKSIRVY